jgi:hypothetical protein
VLGEIRELFAKRDVVVKTWDSEDPEIPAFLKIGRFKPITYIMPLETYENASKMKPHELYSNISVMNSSIIQLDKAKGVYSTDRAGNKYDFKVPREYLDFYKDYLNGEGLTTFLPPDSPPPGPSEEEEITVNSEETSVKITGPTRRDGLCGNVIIRPLYGK